MATKIKDPAKAWKPANLIPTVTTRGSDIHAVIVSRKWIRSLCDAVGARRYPTSWREPVPRVDRDPIGLVNAAWRLDEEIW